MRSRKRRKKTNAREREGKKRVGRKTFARTVDEEKWEILLALETSQSREKKFNLFSSSSPADRLNTGEKL